jgi:hypothetical protein
MKRDGDSALVYSTTLHHVNEDGEYTATAFLRGLTKKGEGIEAASRSIRVMFARQSKEEPTPEHIVVEPKEEKKAASPVIPIVPIGIVIGLGSLAAVALMSRTKKQAKSSASSVGKYVPHKQLIDAISTLEEKISTTSVEINDPIFSMLDKQGDVVAPRTSSAQAEVRQPGDAEEKSAVAPQAQDSAVTQESVMAALPDDV